MKTEERTYGDDKRNAAIVEKLRARYISKTEATEFRGAYFRCSGCSVTWDEDGTEKHGPACDLVPFGCVVVKPADPSA